MTVPTDGTVIWFDMYAIPADAPHPNNAHAFINFMMKPEVRQRTRTSCTTRTEMRHRLPLLDRTCANDPGVYPPPETMAKLFPNLAHTQEFTRELNRTWTRFMTGK